MSVGFSQFESGYAAGRHLLDCGYRRIAIVGAQLDPRSLRRHLRHAPDGLIMTGIDHARRLGPVARPADSTVHTIETLDDGAVSVGFSQFESGYAAGRHLLDCGYRRIAIVGAQLDPRSLRRCEGCRRRCATPAPDPALEIMTPEKSSIGLGAALMDRVHREHPDCDAVFFNDDLAQGAVFQCARLGLAVPGRIGLVGFHDLAGSAWTTPPLSTIATPRYEIGLAAAGLLMRHLAGEAIERRHVDLGFELVRRQTT